MKNLFKLTVLDTDYLNGGQDKIELIGCKQVFKSCDSVISAINESYKEVEQFRYDKDFFRAINTLKDSFYKTFEIQEKSCQGCSNILRSVISDSLENIHDELKSMSTGIFRTKRFQPSYLLAQETLMEFENAVERKKIRINRIENHSTARQSNKKVS